MPENQAIPFSTTTAEAAMAAAQRQVACVTRAWTQLSLDTMKSATAGLEAMTSLFGQGAAPGPEICWTDPPAVLCHRLTQQAKARFDTMLAAQRSASDAFAQAAFNAFDTLADALPDTAPATAPADAMPAQNAPTPARTAKPAG